jgi:hypothetical protein
MKLIDPFGIRKGKAAENNFKKWLDNQNIPYLYINQDKNTFSSIFERNLKRPDFMILIPNLGFIMVDVKHRTQNHEHNTFPLDKKETIKFSKLQRIFNLPTWYAISNSDFYYQDWFWIPVSKVLEEGVEEFRSTKSHQLYFSISLKEFIHINKNDSLEKLFSGVFRKSI